MNTDSLLSEEAVYAIVCDLTGKAYFGATGKAVLHRWSEHLTLLRNGSHWIAALQHDWDALGSQAFSFCILETGLGHELARREYYWLYESQYEPGYYNYRRAEQIRIDLRLRHIEALGRLAKAKGISRETLVRRILLEALGEDA